MKKLIFVGLLLVATSCTIYQEDPYMKSSETVGILGSVDSTEVYYAVRKESETYLVKDNEITYQLQEETYIPVIMAFVFTLIAFIIGLVIGNDR